MINKFFLFCINLWDLLILVPKDVKKRVAQEEHRWVKTMGLILFILLPSAYVAMFFLVDYNKPNIRLWATFRFGLAFAILFLGIISYLFRRRAAVIIVNLYVVALLASLAISWSMSFVPGYVVQSKWVVMVSAFVLLLVARGLITPVLWLFIIVALSSPLWSGYTSVKILLTDTMFAVWLIIIGYSMKKIWIKSKVNQFLHDDAVQANVELQVQLHTEVKKFVPPVLVKKIEEQTQKDKPLSIAVDDIMRRHQSDVAVLFSDIRDFSRRSTDMEFVEKELIPSSIKLIDMVEANGGIAKQIGDAIFAYYSTEGVHPDAPKEAILRAFKDAVIGCLVEKQRIKDLGRDKPERFFSVTYGPALVGNMASSHHREATVIGAPANLAARMDSLTKKPTFKPLIEDGNKILLSKLAKITMDYFEGALKFQEVNLESMNLIMNSFPDEKVIYLFAITKQNLAALNDIDPIDVDTDIEDDI